MHKQVSYIHYMKISQSTIIKKNKYPDFKEDLNRHVTKENTQKSSSTWNDIYVFWLFGKVNLKQHVAMYPKISKIQKD